MKRMVSWALSLMLVFTMIPAFSATVCAEDGNGSPAISIGAGNIEKGNKVYVGIRFFEENAAPISWLVLGDANSADLKNGDASADAKNARLLITEKTQGGVQFNTNGQSIWQGSNIQKWCTETFLNNSDWNGERYQNHFSGLEKEAMLFTSKTDAEYKHWGTSSLNNEQMFLLSAEEVSDDYFSGDESRIAYQHDNDETWDWWLRSPHSFYSNNAARVTPSGTVEPYDVSSHLGARPAFNINLNSVLFTSAAAGGKSSGADALNAIPDNTTNEWKLTLHDRSRDGFTATAADGAVLERDADYTDWSVPVVYSGASAANDNDYVSVILADSNDKALYYGHIAGKTAASSETGQQVTIPAGLAAGDYKLYVFSEQVNGDKLSDYASAFKTIALTVKPTVKVTVPAGKTFTYNGKAQTGVAAGDNYTLSGTTKATNAGTYTAKAALKTSANYTYQWSDGTTAAKTIKWTINKAANPLKIKVKTATVKYSKLKKKTQTLAVTKVIKFTNDAKDKKTYTLVSAKKGKKSFKKYFKINKTAGKVTIKKNKKMKKGTYKVKVKVKALGNSNYKASTVKTVTFKVIVK